MLFTRVDRILAVIAVAAVVAVPAGASAQFGKNQRYLGAHVGMSGVGSAASYGLNGEIAYNEHIGIGAIVDTWSYGWSGLGYNWNLRYISLGGTGAYHFAVKTQPKVDPFVGAALGYYIVSESWNGNGIEQTFSGNGSRLFLGGYGGVRYFFKPNLSGVARAGFGASYLSLGLDLKM